MAKEVGDDECSGEGPYERGGHSDPCDLQEAAGHIASVLARRCSALDLAQIGLWQDPRGGILRLEDFIGVELGWERVEADPEILDRAGAETSVDHSAKAG